MKKHIMLLLSALILGMGEVMADNRLTVSDVDVPQGGQAVIEIGCEFDTDYTAFELQLALPEGLSLLADEDGKPIVERAFDGSHVVSGNLLPSNGNYKFTCYSTVSDALSLPMSGPLLRVTLVADASLAIGTDLSCQVTACEFTRTADSQGENLADAAFTVHIAEYRTILDENATTLPQAETEANVRVQRTLAADEWSTICLPFAMTEEQVTEAFGAVAQVADFTGWSSEEDEEGDIVRISLSFESVTAMEANHPYLIKVDEDVTEFTIDGVDITPEDEPTVQVGKKKAERGYMNGTYVVTDVPEENLVLADGLFAYSDGTVQAKAFSAYFELADVLADTNGAPGQVAIILDGEDITTGISRLHTVSANGSCYNLQGQRLSQPKTGLNIVNGKKIVVKP